MCVCVCSHWHISSTLLTCPREPAGCYTPRWLQLQVLPFALFPSHRFPLLVDPLPSCMVFRLQGLRAKLHASRAHLFLQFQKDVNMRWIYVRPCDMFARAPCFALLASGIECSRRVLSQGSHSRRRRRRRRSGHDPQPRNYVGMLLISASIYTLSVGLTWARMRAVDSGGEASCAVACQGP